MALLKDSLITGDLRVTGTIYGLISGNANTATKLATPRTLTIGSSGKNFDGSAAVSWTLAEIGAAAVNHAHGNITNDGKIGTTANYAVVTTTGGAVTSTSLKVDSPAAATTTSTTFIDTVSQATNGKITATKKTLPSATTSVAGIVQLSSATNSTSTTLAATASAVKSAYDLANGAIPKSVGTAAGDIIYFSAASTPTRLAKGTSGQVLKINSSGKPAWSTDNNYITIRTWS